MNTAVDLQEPSASTKGKMKTRIRPPSFNADDDAAHELTLYLRSIAVKTSVLGPR